MTVISLDGDTSLRDMRNASKDHSAHSNDSTDMQAMASSQHYESIVSLLQQILEQQQAQVSLQKDHLSILKRDSVASAAGDGVHFASEDVSEDPSETDDGHERVSHWSISVPVHHSATQSSHLSKMLAIDDCTDYCPSPKETVRTISGCTSSELPSGLMTDAMLSRQLFIAGVFPKGMFKQQWRFSVYRAVLLVAEVAHCLQHMKSMFVGIILTGRLVPDGDLILLLCQLVLFHPLWRVWVKEFDVTGATFQLLKQMDKRGMVWSDLRRSVRICYATSTLLAIATAGLWYLSISSGDTYTQHLLKQKESRYYQVLGRVSAVVDAIGFSSQLLWLCVFPIHVWIVYLVSSLHRYDLLSYAVAMEKAFDSEGSDPGVEFVPALKKLENVVTARLRLASGGWVRCVVFIIVCMCCAALVLCMLLLTSNNLSFYVLALYSTCAICFFGYITALCLPLAMVAEVFEYDVLRALNNPFILKIAQKHVGQQLLPHLKHLDWGFRVGGTTITAKLVANLATGVLVTMVTSVSQAAFSRAGDV